MPYGAIFCFIFAILFLLLSTEFAQRFIKKRTRFNFYFSAMSFFVALNFIIAAVVLAFFIHNQRALWLWGLLISDTFTFVTLALGAACWFEAQFRKIPQFVPFLVVLMLGWGMLAEIYLNQIPPRVFRGSLLWPADSLANLGTAILALVIFGGLGFTLVKKVRITKRNRLRAFLFAVVLSVGGVALGVSFSTTSFYFTSRILGTVSFLGIFILLISFRKSKADNLP